MPDDDQARGEAGNRSTDSTGVPGNLRGEVAEGSGAGRTATGHQSRMVFRGGIAVQTTGSRPYLARHGQVQGRGRTDRSALGNSKGQRQGEGGKQVQSEDHNLAPWKMKSEPRKPL